MPILLSPHPDPLPNGGEGNQSLENGLRATNLHTRFFSLAPNCGVA